MKIRWFRFNINFAVAAALLTGALLGCKSDDPEKKGLATLRLYMEGKANSMEAGEVVTIHDQPIAVLSEPFLKEDNIAKAELIDTVGGFAISLTYDRRGTWMLEQYTSNNPGKHLVVFSQWITPPETKNNRGRWLAAPKYESRISDGHLVFTPDTTREEARIIVRDLNNVAKKIEKKDKTARW